MRIIIFGGSGFVGSKIAEIASENHLVYSTFLSNEPSFGYRLKADVRNAYVVKKVVDYTKPDVVIHCASLAEPDKCEDDRQLAYDINVKGLENIVEAIGFKNILMIYLSTSSVFDGERGDRRENDLPHPINYYGWTMTESEKWLRSKTNISSLVIRTCMVYGSRDHKRNFASFLLNKLRNGETVEIIDDQWLSPTYDVNLAEMVLECSEKRVTGILHLAGSTRTTRFLFAKALAEAYELDSSLILPISMKSMIWKAKRQRDMSLNVDKALSLLDHKPLNLKDSLERMRCGIDS